MKKHLLLCIAVLTTLHLRAQDAPTPPAATPVSTSTDQADSSTFSAWFQSRVAAIPAPSAQAGNEKLVIANGKGVDRQKDSPATDSRSTSLVDQTSAPDFLSIAANLIPHTSISGIGNSAGTGGSGSVTASLYALVASVYGTGVTDPVFYQKHQAARRLSFTLGTADSTQAIDNTTNPATVVGTKFLILNKREIFSPANNKLRQDLQDEAGALGTARAATEKAAVKLIAAAICPSIKNPENRLECRPAEATFTADTLPKLSASTLKQIDTLIAEGIAEKEAQFDKDIDSTYDKISKAPQISLSYSGNIHTGAGYNHHRGEFIADYGFNNRPLNWTVNASVDDIDRKGASANSTGGRFATEFQYQAVRPPATSTRSSLTLSFSGEADWMTKQKPQYTGQLKVDIPLAPGVSLPVGYRYQNHAAQLNNSDSQMKLGLSIDVAKVVQALKMTN